MGRGKLSGGGLPKPAGELGGEKGDHQRQDSKHKQKRCQHMPAGLLYAGGAVYLSDVFPLLFGEVETAHNTPLLIQRSTGVISTTS